MELAASNPINLAQMRIGVYGYDIPEADRNFGQLMLEIAQLTNTVRDLKIENQRLEFHNQKLVGTVENLTKTVAEKDAEIAELSARLDGQPEPQHALEVMQGGMPSEPVPAMQPVTVESQLEKDYISLQKRFDQASHQLNLIERQRADFIRHYREFLVESLDHLTTLEARGQLIMPFSVSERSYVR